MGVKVNPDPKPTNFQVLCIVIIHHKHVVVTNFVECAADHYQNQAGKQYKEIEFGFYKVYRLECNNLRHNVLSKKKEKTGLVPLFIICPLNQIPLKA